MEASMPKQHIFRSPQSYRSARNSLTVLLAVFLNITRQLSYRCCQTVGMKACIMVVCLMASYLAGAVAGDYDAALPSIDGTSNLRRLLEAHMSAAEQASVVKLQSKAAEASWDVLNAKMDARMDTDTAIKAAAVKGAEKVSDANQKVYEAIKAANAAKLNAFSAGVNAKIPGNDVKDKIVAAKADKVVDLATAKVEKAKSEADKARVKASNMVQTAAAKSKAEGKLEVAAAQQKSDKLSELAKQALVKARSA